MNQDLQNKLKEIERLNNLEIKTTKVEKEDSVVLQIKEEVQLLAKNISEHNSNDAGHGSCDPSQRKVDGKKDVFNSVVANIISSAITFIASTIFYKWGKIVSAVQNFLLLFK